MKKVLGTYQLLCADYYDLHKPVLPDDEWEFYLRYAQEAQGPLLEPMCGTGHFLIPLTQRGFQIEGFDASEAMLARLRTRAKQENLSVNVWLGFLEDLTITNRYKLAFISVGSFNLISKLDAVTISLKALYNALLPGGLLVLELMTYTLACHLPINEWIYAEYEREDKKKIAIKTLYRPVVNGGVEVVRRYALITEQEQTERVEIEEYELRFYDTDQIQQFLQKAGFSQVRVIKAFDHVMLPSKGDHIVIYECKK